MTAKLDVEVDGRDTNVNDTDKQGKNTPVDTQPEDAPEYDFRELEVPPEHEEEGGAPALDHDAAMLELLSSQQEANRLLQQRLDQLERRLSQRAAPQPTTERTMQYGEDDQDDDAAVTDPRQAQAVILKELQRIRQENAALRSQVKQDVEAATYGIRRENAEKELDGLVANLNKAHGEEIFDRDMIVSVKVKNPGMSLAAAAKAVERRFLAAANKAGYRRQVVKGKGTAPELPGQFDTAGRPAYQPAKRATTVAELRKNTEEALKHRGFDELVAEANRVKEVRLRQMEEMDK